MAKLTKVEEIEWNKCGDCPFCDTEYSGDNGYGTGDCYDAHYCQKGYFGEITGENGYDGRSIYKVIDIPQCIPPYCQFSDKPWVQKMTLEQVVKIYNNEEIMCLIDYLRDKKLYKRVNKVNEDFKLSLLHEEPMVDEAFEEHMKQTVKTLRGLGYEIEPQFERFIVED